MKVGLQNSFVLASGMPRNYVKKTDRGSYGPELLEEAVKLVRANEIRVSDAVREYKIPRTTLERHLRSAGVPLLKTGGQTIFTG